MRRAPREVFDGLPEVVFCTVTFESDFDSVAYLLTAPTASTIIHDFLNLVHYVRDPVLADLRRECGHVVVARPNAVDRDNILDVAVVVWELQGHCSPIDHALDRIGTDVPGPCVTVIESIR